MVASLLLLLTFFVLPQATPSESQVGDDPDRLYADRENLTSAERAAALLDALPADRRTYETAWKLARARYWLGGHVGKDAQQEQYERGMEAAMRAVQLDGAKPEGHFWLAANMGAMAEGFGLRAGLRYRGPIKDELETVLRLDPAFQQGSADRGLGRWYFKVPGMLGGSRDKAIEHLRKALEYNPQSTASHFFLAEVLVDMKKNDDARTELNAVLDAPLDPDWTPEDREFKAKASALLKTLPAAK